MTPSPLKLVFAGQDTSTFRELAAALSDRSGLTIRSTSGPEETWQILNNGPIDILIADERVGTVDGAAFVRKVISAYPLINCGLVSPLAPAAFHEATEGLGLFHQLPLHPGAEEAAGLLAAIDKLYGYLDKAASGRRTP